MDKPRRLSTETILNIALNIGGMSRIPPTYSPTLKITHKSTPPNTDMTRKKGNSCMGRERQIKENVI